MKKPIAALMALRLIFCAAAALAAEPEVMKINRSGYEALTAKMEGRFAAVSETGLKMFIPAEFRDTEISEETPKGGTFPVLKRDKDEKAIVNAQRLAVAPDAFKAEMESKGLTLYPTELNGLPCLQFNVEAGGVTTGCFAFGTENGGIAVFSFSPINREPCAAVYKVTAASIRRAEQ